MKTKIKTYPYKNLANNKIKKLHRTMCCLSDIRQMSLKHIKPIEILRKLHSLEKTEYQNVKILNSIRDELENRKSIVYLEDSILNMVCNINTEIKNIIDEKDLHSRKEEFISSISSISKTE